MVRSTAAAPRARSRAQLSSYLVCGAVPRTDNEPDNEIEKKPEDEEFIKKRI